jgi:hypothetical protein
MSRSPGILGIDDRLAQEQRCWFTMIAPLRFTANSIIARRFSAPAYAGYATADDQLHAQKESAVFASATQHLLTPPRIDDRYQSAEITVERHALDAHILLRVADRAIDDCRVSA